MATWSIRRSSRVAEFALMALIPLDSLLDFPLYPIRHAFAEGKPIDEIPKTLAKDYLYTNSDPRHLARRTRRWPLHEREGRDDRRTQTGECVGVDYARRAAALLRRRDRDGRWRRADHAWRFPRRPGDKRNAFTAQGAPKKSRSCLNTFDDSPSCAASSSRCGAAR